MDRLMSLLLCFLSVAATGSHAALTPELYWKSVLPNTPMPSAISQLLTSAEGTSVAVGKGGVHVNAGQGKPGSTTVGVGKGGVNVNTGSAKPGGTNVNVGHGGVGVNVRPGGTNVNVGHGGVGVNVRPGGTNVNARPGGVGVNVRPGGTNVNVGSGGVGVHAGPGGTNVNVGNGGVGVNVNPHGKPPRGKPPGKPGVFVYNYAATETQLHDDPNVALFFLEKDLHAGTKLAVHFTTTTSGATFLPRSEADAIPFSSKKLPEILNHFAVRPDSIEAADMTQTLHDCEEPAAKGEKKVCATSLESMVDFATSSLGTSHVKAVSTVVGKAGTAKQEYTVTGVKRMAGGDQLVACHAEAYAYAVFQCHLTQATRGYTVSMVGKDGTAVEAAAVCHTDTAAWNPRHVAFQVLGVKPGTVPVCHFLPEDHVIWTRSA